MAKRRSAKSHSKRHGDISNRPGKAMDPQDHVAHDLKNLPTQKYQGQGLGTEPSQATMPQTMQGPIDYPGQELGA
jgi:hypothetical protein